MAATNSRVVLNRAALGAITLGMADGLLALAEAVIDRTKAPDAPVLGAGLVDTGGTVAYAAGKKVGGAAAKPNAMKVQKMGVAVAGGFGLPAHFVEFGTIHQPARPFLTPVLMATVPGAGPFVARAVARRLATVGKARVGK